MKKKMAKKIYLILFCLISLILKATAPEAPPAPDAPDAPMAPAAPDAPGVPAAPGMPAAPAGPVGAGTEVTQDEITAWPAGTQVKIGREFIAKAGVNAVQIKGSTKIKLPSGEEIFAKSADYEEWKKQKFHAQWTPGSSAAASAKKIERKPKTPEQIKQLLGRQIMVLKVNIQNFEKAEKANNISVKVDAYDILEQVYNAFLEATDSFASLAKENHVPEKFNSHAKLKAFLDQQKASIDKDRKILLEKERAQLEEAAKLRIAKAKEEQKNKIRKIVDKKEYDLPEKDIKASVIAIFEKDLRDIQNIIMLLDANEINEKEFFSDLSAKIKNKKDLIDWHIKQEAKVQAYRIKYPKRAVIVDPSKQHKISQEELKKQMQRITGRPAEPESPDVPESPKKIANHKNLGSFTVELAALSSIKM